MGKYNSKYSYICDYTGASLYNMLKEYSHAVHRKEHEPIPYAKWRILSDELKNAKPTDKYEVGCNEDGDVYIQSNSFSMDLPSYWGLAKFLVDDISWTVDMHTPVKSAGYFDPWGEWHESEEEGFYTASGAYVPKRVYTSNGRKIEKEKENENMKGLNFDFGPCTNDGIKLSMYGVAIRNAAGNYVSYNKQTGDIIDVDCLNFDGGQFLFKMPVPIKDIKTGDVVIHNKKAMFVTTVDKGNVGVVDISAGEIKSIIPTKSMFGFDFVTKIVSIMDAVAGAPSPNEPFGNMLPFLMMQDGKMDKNMVLALMMSQNGGNFAANPMLMYLMMSDGKNNNDMLPLMLMMGGNFGAQAPVVPQQMELALQ